ncbi:MAG TPA: thioredoxin domain-containing protein, partial [Fibrobacteria bacterium]|nr:thioredoxin domain-containing protein [Fibrobacteria bacterium]
MPNALARAASPYLRQHQDNPVDWMEWGDEAFEKARRENKFVLVSSGYAACHWCHVMAHESFEDEGIAAIMNRDFVCVKVDREERPDVDQVYLDAVQLMSGRGGWPLNCFVLPDGRPVYGGTYFPKAQWTQLLENLAAMGREQPAAIEEQAGKITERLRLFERASGPRRSDPMPWPETVASFAARFDRDDGGTGRAPKFPMPCEWSFLLRYSVREKDERILKQVRLTLDRMLAGGIHDQLAGGFARYSVDGEWKVPHFEKMLYDNAQLLRLYAEASVALREPAYASIARGIADFVENELSAPGGGYCSALDADSEGEEGLFYVWTRAELAEVLGDRFPAFADLFCVNTSDDAGEAHWEHGRHVLLRPHSVPEWGARHGWGPEEAELAWEQGRRDLLAYRARRERPMRDDKVLTGWNGLMIEALASASRLLGDGELLERARRGADFLLAKAKRPEGGLWRRGWNSGAGPEFGIEGFLEDYACLARALVELYQA